MELRLQIPTKLIDLTPAQLRYVSLLFLTGISETEFLTKALMYLSGLKLAETDPDGARWFRHKSLAKPFILDVDVLTTMTEKCRFLLSPAEVRPPKWIGMARARHPRLYNASFDEYLMAENYYFAYVKTKDPLHLDNLISVLYRRPWCRWNAGKIQQRAKIFRNVDPAVKNSVFMWYIGFRSYIPKRCPTLFSGKKSNRPFHPRDYINGMIHQLSNGDITLKGKLLKQPALDALDELEQRAVEVELLTKK